MKAQAILKGQAKIIPFDKKEEKLMSKEEYFAKINKSVKEIEEGKIIEVSAEEMRRILSE